MLKAMIEKIEKMSAPSVYDIGSEHYASKELVRIDPKKDFPKSITLTGLESVCKMVRNEAAAFPDSILIQISDYRSVNVFTKLDGEMDRYYLYHCEADTPMVSIGRYISQSEMIVQLQSLYIPNKDTQYLLQLLSSISSESKVTSNDNGVTQVVEARSGIALTSAVSIKPRVSLKPFRTFLEVFQPESEFILRLDKDGDIGLFEADGGVWKLEATRNIAGYFEESLKDLISTGKVIVLR